MAELVLHTAMGALLVSLMTTELVAMTFSLPLTTLPWRTAAILVTLLIAGGVALGLSGLLARRNRQVLMQRLFD